MTEEKLKEAILYAAITQYNDELNHIGQEIKALERKNRELRDLSDDQIKARFTPFDIENGELTAVHYRQYKPTNTILWDYYKFTDDDIKHAAQLMAQRLKEPVEFKFKLQPIDPCYVYGI